jgi:dipeptidase E
MQDSILLISSSAVHGYGFLEYNKDAVQAFVSGINTPVLFVPYAADKNEWDSYTDKARGFFNTIGIKVTGAHTVPKETICTDYEVIFVGGGNTFRLLHELQQQQLLPAIRAAVMSGKVRYMGSSAGSNIAGKTICTTNDMPIVYPKDGFESLALIPYQLNPHYLDPDPDSKHKGETRDQRLAEYHQMNDTPVIGIREGAYLSINIATPDTFYVGGKPGARIFERGKTPYEAPKEQTVRL